MEWERIAGVLLCAVGLLLAVRPTLVHALAARWKAVQDGEPSGGYMWLVRVLSGTTLGVGVLLAAGVLK